MSPASFFRRFRSFPRENGKKLCKESLCRQRQREEEKKIFIFRECLWECCGNSHFFLFQQNVQFCSGRKQRSRCYCWRQNRRLTSQSSPCCQWECCYHQTRWNRNNIKSTCASEAEGMNQIQSLIFFVHSWEWWLQNVQIISLIQRNYLQMQSFSRMKKNGAVGLAYQILYFT